MSLRPRAATAALPLAAAPARTRLEHVLAAGYAHHCPPNHGDEAADVGGMFGGKKKDKGRVTRSMAKKVVETKLAGGRPFAPAPEGILPWDGQTNDERHRLESYLQEFLEENDEDLEDKQITAKGHAARKAAIKGLIDFIDKGGRYRMDAKNREEITAIRKESEVKRDKARKRRKVKRKILKTLDPDY